MDLYSHFFPFLVLFYKDYQGIPLIKQARPIIKNAKTMFKVMNEFKKIRTNLFSSDFLEKHDMNSSRYVKLYQKEVGLLKK